jgi:sugar phosphate isomerase/epimerase
MGEEQTSRQARPRFSVAAITAIDQTYEQDLAVFREAGAEGIALWESKLADRKDSDSIAELRESGLHATTCIPEVVSIWPIPFPGPSDPNDRIRALCSAVRRFAAFEAEILLCVTGRPPNVPPAEARRVVVEGLREVAKVANEHGIQVGLEPLHRTLYPDWTIIGTIPETVELLDEIGEPNVGVAFDVYHLWDTNELLEDIVRYGDRILPCVHVNDRREPPRNDFDRVLPGDGIADLPGIFGAMEAAGVVGWFELEIFSDDGRLTDRPLADSLWQEDPLEVVRRGKAGFERAWAARRAPESAPGSRVVGQSR